MASHTMNTTFDDDGKSKIMDMTFDENDATCIIMNTTFDNNSDIKARKQHHETSKVINKTFDGSDGTCSKVMNTTFDGSDNVSTCTEEMNATFYGTSKTSAAVIEGCRETPKGINTTFDGTKDLPAIDASKMHSDECLQLEADIKLIEDEEFNFDLPQSSEDESFGRNEEEGEVFFGPVTHTEQCVSGAVEEQAVEDDMLKPLSAKEMVQLFTDANIVAYHILSEAAGCKTPTDKPTRLQRSSTFKKEHPVQIKRERCNTFSKDEMDNSRCHDSGPLDSMSDSLATALPTVKVLPIESKVPSSQDGSPTNDGVFSFHGSKTASLVAPVKKPGIIRRNTFKKSASNSKLQIPKISANTQQATKINSKYENIVSPNKRQKIAVGQSVDRFETCSNASNDSETSTSDSCANGKRGLSMMSLRGSRSSSQLPRLGRAPNQHGHQRSLSNSSHSSTTSVASSASVASSTASLDFPRSKLARPALNRTIAGNPSCVPKSVASKRLSAGSSIGLKPYQGGLSAPSTRLKPPGTGLVAPSGSKPCLPSPKKTAKSPSKGLKCPAAVKSGLMKPTVLPSKNFMGNRTKICKGRGSGLPSLKGPMKALSQMFKPGSSKAEKERRHSTESPGLNTKSQPGALNTSHTKEQPDIIGTNAVRRSKSCRVKPVSTPVKPDKCVQPKRILGRASPEETDGDQSVFSSPPHHSTNGSQNIASTPISVKRRSLLPTPSKQRSASQGSGVGIRSSSSSVGSVDATSSSPSLGVLTDVNGIADMSPSAFKTKGKKARVCHTPIGGFQKENDPIRSRWSPVKRKQVPAGEEAIQCTKWTIRLNK